MPVLTVDAVTASVASDSIQAPAPVRDALAFAARDAAEWREQTDEHQARALRLLAALIRISRDDEHALRVLAGAPQALRDEIAGATEDPWVIAAVEVASQGGNEK